VRCPHLGGGGSAHPPRRSSDLQSSAYVTGPTSSAGSPGGFPTQNAIQASNGGGTDAFVAKLNAAGSGLVYSTYLGGSGATDVGGMAEHAQGRAYLTGLTCSARR